MLKIYYSNRQEQLLALLADALARPKANPLQSDILIVQSQGMSRWLSQQLAELNGVAANLEFQLPAQLVWRLARLCRDDLPELHPFDKSILTWRLMQLAPALPDSGEFDALHRYLHTGPDRKSPDLLRNYQLSQRIADVFDHYLMYRPDWLSEWEQGLPTEASGSEHAWQIELWRGLTRDSDAPHRARVLQELAEQLPQHVDKLPPRLFVFGVPYMAPAYLDVLQNAARHIEVHMYQWNPTEHYWGDIASRKDISRIRTRDGAEVSGLYDEGHRLLASWGKPLRDYLDVLQDVSVTEADCYVPPAPPHTLLQHLQADVFNLRQEPWPESPADDRSLQVHLCHSALREVEVLYDQLMDLLQTDHSLSPRDIVVMTPDIGQYAPLVEAVFGAQEGPRRIPWSLADLSRYSDFNLVQSVLQLFDLLPGRFTASEVLGLLEIPAVGRRFGLDEELLSRLRQWLLEASIRWGLDAESQQAYGVDCADQFSWKAGIKRLLLGFALPDAMQMYQDVAPYPHIQGGDADSLGALSQLIDTLARWRAQISRGQTPQQWADLLHSWMNDLFDPDRDEEQALQVAREAVQEWLQETQTAGFDQPLPLAVVKQDLRRRLDSPLRRQSFLTGAVTFCAMVPMRSIPFRVVAVLGLNHDQFPRRQTQPGFDLIAAYPRKGDRARREEDRFLFLEALLAARDVFYLSYVGRSIRDNSECAPSVILSELLDTIQEQGGEAAMGRILTEHPLQPFSPHYFTADGGHFSYQSEWLPALHGRHSKQEYQAFCPESLPSREHEPFSADHPVELDSLRRFLRNPTRYFVQQRLNILLDASDLTQDREPFDLGGLHGFQVKELWLQELMNAATDEEAESYLEAKGLLPGGAVGAISRKQTRQQLEALREQARELYGKDRIEITPEKSGLPLRGAVAGIGPRGLLHLTTAGCNASRMLLLWLEHLALCSVTADALARPSFLVCRQGVGHYRPVAQEQARKLLAELIDLLSQSENEPVRFFPKTSLKYVETKNNPRSRSEPINAAQQCWLGNEWQPGELADAHHFLVWRFEAETLNERFVALAEGIWEPALEHWEAPA
ncbi:exodeoxyribonuclease V subunit gamma [Hahella aquimaris]|uniref:exodeoxyribonuclease V subunit gamma n=1 Tax=Hahella sp. HNIBRBA332 TaxID=3015983 RepID=UPI00273B646A|nr:exodeoxyribonuclease V subunit gamma [Hahella sp. HNIBRBA332]WLQ12853.1 exodeoxyribonuclease V subunit gamma [Hahella sp. HNIBRBA332]